MREFQRGVEMRKQRILLVTIGLALLLGLIGAAGVGAEEPRRSAGAPVVQAQGSKFCLDGVLYEVEEFNGIVEELRSKGVNLITVVYENGNGCNFTSVEKCDEYAVKHGLHPCSEPPVSESNAQPLQVCPLPSSYWSKNWEHIHCAGDALWVAPNVAIPDLRNPCPNCGNWNDRISSAQAATSIYRQILYEHINYGGAQLYIWAGWTYPDLREVGWNDRASSLWTQP